MSMGNTLYYYRAQRWWKVTTGLLLISNVSCFSSLKGVLCCCKLLFRTVVAIHSPSVPVRHGKFPPRLAAPNQLLTATLQHASQLCLVALSFLAAMESTLLWLTYLIAAQGGSRLPGVGGRAEEGCSGAGWGHVEFLRNLTIAYQDEKLRYAAGGGGYSLLNTGGGPVSCGRDDKG